MQNLLPQAHGRETSASPGKGPENHYLSVLFCFCFSYPHMIKTD